jgi:hypothetical protein
LGSSDSSHVTLDLDASSDIEIDGKSGLWQWSERALRDKPRLVADVALRKEDE